MSSRSEEKRLTLQRQKEVTITPSDVQRMLDEIEIERRDREFRRKLPIAARVVLWLRSWHPDYGQK